LLDDPGVNNICNCTRMLTVQVFRDVMLQSWFSASWCFERK